MDLVLLTALLHSGHKASQRDLWGQLHHGRRRGRSHRHWSSNKAAETESDGGIEQIDIIEKRSSPNGDRNEDGKRHKKLVSERNSAGSIAEQLIYTFPISVLL